MTVSGGTQPNDTVDVLTFGDDNKYNINNKDAESITFYACPDDSIVTVIQSTTGFFPITDNAKNKYVKILLSCGDYKIECWGGEGAGVLKNNTIVAYGGKGGYVSGVTRIQTDSYVTIAVGTMGSSSYIECGVFLNMPSGSGGIDLPGYTPRGMCAVYLGEDNTGTLLACAGCGGSGSYSEVASVYGGPYAYDGKYGGGVTGGEYISGTGGTQTTGESFMVAGVARRQQYSGQHLRGATGNGYYSGKITGQIAIPGVSQFYYYGGAGGSGYVNTTYLTNTQNIAGNQQFLSPDGYVETGHSGDCVVRISKYKTITDNILEIPQNEQNENIYTNYTADLLYNNSDEYTRKIHINGTNDILNVCSHEFTNNSRQLLNNVFEHNYILTSGSHYLDGNIDKYGDVYIKQNDSWITSKKGTYIKRNGDWAKSKSVYVKENGFWKTMMPNSVTINFSLDGETIEPIVSYMGCTIVPPNNGDAITWRDDDDNDVTNGYRIDSAVDSITLYGSVE